MTQQTDRERLARALYIINGDTCEADARALRWATDLGEETRTIYGKRADRLLGLLGGPPVVVQGEPRAWECACGGVMPWHYKVCGECGEMVRADTAATHLYAGAPAAQTISREDAMAVRRLAETLAARLAYACELGAGEWEAMLSDSDRALLSCIPTEEMNDAER